MRPQWSQICRQLLAKMWISTESLHGIMVLLPLTYHSTRKLRIRSCQERNDNVFPCQKYGRESPLVQFPERAAPAVKIPQAVFVFACSCALLVAGGCGSDAKKSNSEPSQITAGSLVGGKKSKGMATFKENCAECHGVDAAGVSAPNIRGIDPAIFAGVVNDPPSPMLSRQKILQKRYKDLYAFLSSLPEQPS